MQGKELFKAQEFNEAQHGRDQLGQYGGQGHACNAHAVYQRQVQYDVQHGGDQQEAQRGKGIAQSAEHAGQYVVVKESGNADKIDVQVLAAAVKHAGQRSDGPQQGRRDQRADDHDDHTGKRGDGYAVAYGLSQGFAVPGAEILGYQDTGAGGDAHKKCQQQVQHGHGVSHGPQGGIAPAAVADHHGVYGIVQLLRKIPQQHGKGKLRNAFPGSSLAHVPRSEPGFHFFQHNDPPSSFKGKACPV